MSLYKEGMEPTNKTPMFTVKPVTGTVDEFGNRIQIDWRTGKPIKEGLAAQNQPVANQGASPFDVQPTGASPFDNPSAGGIPTFNAGGSQ
jgi:hypothetical protein